MASYFGMPKYGNISQPATIALNPPYGLWVWWNLLEENSNKKGIYAMDCDKLFSGKDDLMLPDVEPVESQIPHVFLQCFFMNGVCLVFSQNPFNPGHLFSYLPVSSQGTVLRIRLLLNLV